MLLPLRRPFVQYRLINEVKAHLKDQDIDEFAVWAFGKDYLSMCGVMKFAEKWNELHKDLYEVKMHSSIGEDVEIMCRIWKENK